MNYVPRNIVILFDTFFTEQLIHISREIDQKVPSDIVLNSSNMIPHATLYTTNYPVKNEQKVLQKLFLISQKIHAFPIMFSRPVVDMMGVWVNAEITLQLQDIHNKIVDGLNDFREGLYDEKELIAIGNNEKRKESLFRYGMWAAKELYVPHVTLSRPKDQSKLSEALRVLPNKVDFQTRIKEIAYVERGPFGTCKRILQKFQLDN